MTTHKTAQGKRPGPAQKNIRLPYNTACLLRTLSQQRGLTPVEVVESLIQREWETEGKDEAIALELAQAKEDIKNKYSQLAVPHGGGQVDEGAAEGREP